MSFPLASADSLVLTVMSVWWTRTRAAHQRQTLAAAKSTSLVSTVPAVRPGAVW